VKIYIFREKIEMSIEALAMAGVDYTESGLRFEEWPEQISGLEQPPLHLLAEQNSPEKSSGLEQPTLHLLAEQNSCIEAEKMGGDVMLVANREWTKARMRQWAKAVAALMEDR
jgi:hypothetical protein